jgi:hypothetical protein
MISASNEMRQQARRPQEKSQRLFIARDGGDPIQNWRVCFGNPFSETQV